MNNFLHYYYLLNGAIILSYFLIKLVLSFPSFHKTLSQLQQLQLSRTTLLITIILFFIAPTIITQLPTHQDNAFQLQPILKHASTLLLQNPIVINTSKAILPTETTLPSFSMIIELSILLISFIFSTYYCKHIFALYRITKGAHRQRKIKHIHLLFSDHTSMPFCWSLFKSYFVIIPHHFLTKPSDLKLAIRHELQHIRQGDTNWLHVMGILKLICFWNPCIYLLNKWFTESQEFACDEALILRQKTSRTQYAQCLLDSASSQAALGVIGFSQQYHSLLSRRITMLFNYKNARKKKLSLIFAYAICFLSASTIAYAVSGNNLEPLNAKELHAIFTTLPTTVKITPEVVTEINRIRNSEQARSYMQAALKRMKQYQPYIEAALKKNTIPNDLLALPLIESGYQPLEQSQNRLHAAGIWQFIPSTAKTYGLVINGSRDDRLNTERSTNAAVQFLNALYEKYHDWKVATIAYEYGDKLTDQLIQKTSSRDAWKLAHSSAAPKELKTFLATYDATVLIINHPQLID